MIEALPILQKQNTTPTPKKNCDEDCEDTSLTDLARPNEVVGSK